MLERSVTEALRVGDVMLETRARSYLAIALRRIDEIERSRAVAETASALASRVGDDYYAGHAEAVLGWCDWRTGDVDSAESRLTSAIERWGRLESRGAIGINAEFAWLAAWPLAAIQHARGNHGIAAEHLRLLTVPWERPMDPALEAAVTAATSDPGEGSVAAAIELARERRLL
jgi:hypothetical protein